MGPAVVLGSFETALGIVWGLRPAGVPVHVVDVEPWHAARSRHARFHLCPDPASEPSQWVDRVCDLAASLADKPALFITSDAFVHAAADHRAVLEDAFFCNLPSVDLVGRITDKARQHRLAAEADVALPATALVSDASDVSMALETCRLPAIVKGQNAHAWRAVFGGGKKGFLVRDAHELGETLRSVLDQGVSVVVQEAIQGPDSNHFKVSGLMGRDGRPLAFFVLRKIRQHPPGLGFGCAVETVHQPELLELGVRLFRDIGYRGVGSAEFKYDERDRRFKLIEINPRYWQQCALAAKAGMNIPLLDYREARGEAPEPITEWRAGERWVNVWHDWETAREMHRLGTLSYRDWIVSLRGAQVSDFALHDPLPGLWSWSQALRVRVGRRLGAHRVG